MGKASARAKFDSSIMNLKSIRRKTMYRKTIITTIMLLVAAIALSAAAFANAQECCKAKQECCKAEQEPGAAQESAAEAGLQDGAQTATVGAGNGFEPSSFKLKAGAPAKVTSCERPTRIARRRS